MTARTRWWTFAIVCLALFMAMLDNLVVVTALPSIRKALGASVSDLEWTVNAYTLTFATLMITGAALGDLFGRKRVFLIGVGLFTVGSALARPNRRRAMPVCSDEPKPSISEKVTFSKKAS